MSQHAQTRYSLVLPPPTDAHHDCQRKNTQNSRNMTPRVAALASDGAHRRSREHAWERHRCGDERRRGGSGDGENDAGEVAAMSMSGASPAHRERKHESAQV